MASPKAFPKITTTYRVIGSSIWHGRIDTAYVTVKVSTRDSSLNNLALKMLSCSQDTVTLINSPKLKNYQWSPQASVSNPRISKPIANLQKDSVFTYTATDTAGDCNYTGSVTVKKRNNQTLAKPDTTVCSGTQINIGYPA